jgi:hypothetical protein
LAAALGLACLAVAGCGRKGDYGIVRGTVTFNGQPVSEGMVVFFEPQLMVYQGARIQPNGSYSVAMSSGPGILVGDYQVTVMPPVIESPGSKAFGPMTVREYPNIPLKYRNPRTSPLKVSVVEGDNPPFDIEMKP